jgi:RimJ/RimL family protein N-acetyltransferase/16S rRNA G966 N2-methylase RsmD
MSVYDLLIVPQNEMTDTINKNALIHDLLVSNRDEYLAKLSRKYINMKIEEIIKTDKKYFMENDKNATQYFIICLIDGKPVGMCKMIHFSENIKNIDFFQKLIKNYNVSNALYIYNMYVLKSERGKGICNAILKYIKTFINENGIHISIADIRDDNKSSIKCFTKNGYTNVHITSRNENIEFYVLRTTHDIQIKRIDNTYYELTKEKFFELVNNFKPKIIDKIPEQMKDKHKIVKYNNNYLLIQEKWNENEELNNVTDYFTESERIKCNFKNKISPHEYWIENRTGILKSFKMVNDGKNKIKTIRDTMYRRTKFCNNFRITVAITILKLFNARKWLDISAGWGDRLLSAIACKLDAYVGVDPNEELHEHYDEMIEMLVEPEKRKNFILIKDGFETATLPKNNYDIVFSSPPFFDLEVYSTYEKDSLITHTTVDKWYDDFLIVSLKKAIDNLIIGGHMILYMGESTATHYIDNMISYVNTKMKYTGSIYYYYENVYIPRQMYVWKKVSDTS